MRGKWVSGHQRLRRETSLIAVDKIFERLLCNQVTCHYDKTLYYRMTAYRKKHSCETTLLVLIEDWKLAADTKQLVYMLSTDMSKAFDSLSHSLTTKKLEAYAFGRRSLGLMRSFFENRQNRVKLGEITSDWITMKRGCHPWDHPSDPYFGTCFKTICHHM